MRLFYYFGYCLNTGGKPRHRGHHNNPNRAITEREQRETEHLRTNRRQRVNFRKYYITEIKITIKKLHFTIWIIPTNRQ